MKSALRSAVIMILLFLAVVLFGSSTASSAYAVTAAPGWGFGDANHIHLGPPGLSVRPEDTISQTNNTSLTTNIIDTSNTGGNSANGNTSSVFSLITEAISNTISIVTTAASNVFSGL